MVEGHILLDVCVCEIGPNCMRIIGDCLHN